MKKSHVILIFILFSSSTILSEEDGPGIFTRLYRAIFGPYEMAQPTDDSTSDNSNTSRSGIGIGAGVGGTATGMTSVIVSGGDMSEEGRLALEREKTRQIEIAAQERLEQEHERNRWFNTLVEYFHEQITNGDPKDLEKIKKLGEDLLRKHHELLKDLEKEHNKTLKEIEEKRNETDLKKLPTLLDHDLKQRKLLHEQAMEKLRYIGDGLASFTQDKERVLLVSAALAGLILATYTSKRGTDVAAKYVTSLLMKPNLVTETSRRNLAQMMNPFRETNINLPKAIYNKELGAQIDTYVNSITLGRQDGQPFRHALFFGLPGTGKTLLAKKIAYELGMDFAIVNAANIIQFGDKAVEELNKLFDWASRAKNGTVIFLDEADAIFGKRTSNMNELVRQIQNTFYARTGTENNKILIICATNTPEILDQALISRLDNHLEFPLPDSDSRRELLKHYMNKYATTSDMKVQLVLDDILNPLATSTESFSGREISQLTRAIRAEAYAKNREINETLVWYVVRQIIKNKENLQKYSSSKAA